MAVISSLFILGAVIFFCFLLLKILSAPIRLILKLLINTAFGYIILFVVSFLGEFVGISLGINFINALVTGFLGIPGVILLIALKLFL